MRSTSKTRLKTAIVGCGKVAGTHALAYRALPNSELVSVCDISPERAQAFAKSLEVNAYTDLAEMLKREQLDVLPAYMSFRKNHWRSTWNLATEQLPPRAPPGSS